MTIKHFTLTGTIALSLFMGLALGTSPTHAASGRATTAHNPSIVVKKSEFKNRISDSDGPVITLVVSKDCTSCAATEKIFRDLANLYVSIKFVIVVAADTHARPDQLPAITTSQPRFFVTIVARAHNVNWAGNSCSDSVADPKSVKNFMHKRLNALVRLAQLAHGMRAIWAERDVKRELLVKAIDSYKPGPARDNQVARLFSELDQLILSHEEIVKKSLALLREEAEVN